MHIFDWLEYNRIIIRFTAAVGRPGLAREAREAVQKAISTANPLRKPPLAEPVDYEKFVREKSILLENDPQRDLLLFPRDDIAETSHQVEPPTEVPSATEADIESARWLLTKEALRLYAAPYSTVEFNYLRFAGDYNTVLENTNSDADAALASLVFESDIAQEEEKAVRDGFLMKEKIKEGWLVVVKTDPTLLDKYKSEKKRYCVLKRTDNGDITVQISRGPNMPPTKLPLRVSSCQIKKTKKDKTILEMKSQADDDTLSGNKEPKDKGISFMSESPNFLEEWNTTVNLALSLKDKGDQSNGTLDALERKTSRQENQGDSESIHSEDSGGSVGRESTYWRGRNTAVRALQPPIVERRNLFALYNHLEPFVDWKGDGCSLLETPDSKPTPQSTVPSTPTINTRISFSDRLTVPQITYKIEVKRIDLRLPIAATQMEQIEPFFLRVFLFDCSSGRRITEEVHIDINSADLTAIWKINRERKISSTSYTVNQIPSTVIGCGTARTMSCTIQSPNRQLWVVARVDRVLNPDVQGELYMRSAEPKAVVKLQKMVAAACTRLGTYRTRFAWTARPLVTTGPPGTHATMPVFRCEGNKLSDSDLQRYLQDYNKIEKASKMTIPGATATITVETVDDLETIPFRVSPSLLPLRPWKSPKDSPIPPCFEMQTFGDDIQEPHSDLVNLLYVYPLKLKYDSQKVFGKARNIVCTVKYMRAGEVVDGAIIDRLGIGGPFVSQGTCAVQHHQQCPVFCEEIKMRLPLCLQPVDHLLFQFSHVSVAGVNSVKSPGESVETPVGYSWLPMLSRKDRLMMECDEQEFSLPVAVELPQNYYNCNPLAATKDDGVDVRWVDTKHLFSVRLRMVSSAFTTEPRLHSFFQACQKLETLENGDDLMDLQKSTDSPRSCSPLARSPENENRIVRELESRVEDLATIDIRRLLLFLPTLLRRILILLTASPTDRLALTCLNSITLICNRLTSSGYRTLLRQFIQKQCEEVPIGQETVHASVVKYIPLLLQRANPNEELSTILRQMWFLLDVTVKTLTQHILRNGMNRNPRNERLSRELLDQFGAFVDISIKMIVTKHADFPEETRLANTALANFYRCCLSLIDRGAVFRWIYTTILKLDESEAKMMRQYKVDLLAVLFQHEHLLPLSLPVLLDEKNAIQRINYSSTAQQEPTTINAGNTAGFLARFITKLFHAPSLGEQNETERYSHCSREWWLSPDYFSRHFPVALLLQEMYESLREPRDYRRKPVMLLRNLLAKHSFDFRYVETNTRRRIAVLYAPLIRFALDHISELEAAVEKLNKDTNPSLNNLLGCTKWHSLDRSGKVGSESNRFPNYPTTSRENAPQIAPLAEKLDLDEVQDVLISSLWVLHRIPPRILGLLWSECVDKGAMKFLRFLELTLEVFRYRGRKHALNTSRPTKRSSIRALIQVPSVQPMVENDGSDDGTSQLPFGVLQAINLSQEVAMTVLDTMDTFLRELAAQWQVGSSTTWEESFRYLLLIHLSLLETHWPEGVRLNALASLGAFINQFRPRLFESGSLDALALLIEKLLLQMASRLSTIQSASSALFQFVLRAGYETVQNTLSNKAMALSVSPAGKDGESKRDLSAAERLGRPGTQAGVALARLLGTQQGLAGCVGRFERGLCYLEALIPRERQKVGDFEGSVRELVKQLRGVLEATSALAPASNDPVPDLHIQLADSYRGSAAYRSLWFDTLAEAHAADGWHSEAAVAYGHSVAIIAKELALKGALNSPDWTVLDWISSTIGIKEDVRNKGIEVVQPAEFTLENLATKIESCTRELTLAERYEAIGPIYRLLIPSLEKNRNYNSLRSVYADLNQSSSRALEAAMSGRRHLGAYFKVVFIGLSHFGKDLHMSEWIYREPGLTSLAEASCSLRENCQQLLGTDRIKIEPESELDPDTLDSTMAYIQVTHVEPVCEDERESLSFETHTNCSTFTYESPIMVGEPMEEKGEPPLHKQGLKKTFLIVSESFPCNRRRLPVVKEKKRIEILSPIKFACQKLKTKARQISKVLDATTEGRQLDLKGLQLLLQGAVMPTVNAGPLAYAEAFSQPDQRELYGEHGIEELCEAFRDLMMACDKGLTVNGQAIGPDQQKYHEVLIKSAEAMLERLAGYFGTSFRRSFEEKPDTQRSPIHLLDTISGISS
ncbi:unnamed protein product, partial [Mesorhabditis spiculigera]